MLLEDCTLHVSRGRKRKAETEKKPMSSEKKPKKGAKVLSRFFFSFVSDAIIGHRQSWLFPADFGPILGYFGLFKTKSWLSPADASSHRHALSVSWMISPNNVASCPGQEG